MPKADTISTFGIATSDSAYNHWLALAKTADKQATLSSALYDLWEQTYYCTYPETGWARKNAEGLWEPMKGRPSPKPEETPNIPYTKESLTEYLNTEGSYWLEKLTLEEIFECLNWKDPYAYDGDEHMYYWRDGSYAWDYNNQTEETIDLVYELAVGGPNAHLIFTFNKEDMMPYPNCSSGIEKVEFQYHWWSPTYCIDFTERPENPNAEESLMYEQAWECLEQIYEECYDNLHLESQGA